MAACLALCLARVFSCLGVRVRVLFSNACDITMVIPRKGYDEDVVICDETAEEWKLGIQDNRERLMSLRLDVRW